MKKIITGLLVITITLCGMDVTEKLFNIPESINTQQEIAFEQPASSTWPITITMALNQPSPTVEHAVVTDIQAPHDTTIDDVHQIRKFFLDFYKGDAAQAFDTLFKVFEKLDKLSPPQLRQLGPSYHQLKYYVNSMITILHDKKTGKFHSTLKPDHPKVVAQEKELAQHCINFLKTFFPETAEKDISQLLFHEKAHWFMHEIKRYNNGKRLTTIDIPEISASLKQCFEVHHENLETVVSCIKAGKFEQAKQYIIEHSLQKIYPKQLQVIEKIQTDYAKNWLNKFGIERPSEACLDFAKKILQGNKTAFINKAIETLHANHLDPSMKQLYHALFDENGIYREFSEKAKNVLPENLHSKINTRNAVEQRKLLNELVQLPDMPFEVKNAIKQVAASLENKDLAAGYMSIAQEMKDAIKYKRSLEILAIEDLGILAKNRTQKIIYQKLVPIVAMLSKKLNLKNQSNIGIADRQLIIEALIHCATVLHEAKENNFAEVTNIFNTKAIPSLQKLSSSLEINELIVLAKDLMPLDQQAAALSPKYAQRQEKRWQVQDANHVDDQLVLADKTIELLYEYNINAEKYQQKYDKPIVQRAANEAIDIFNQAADLKQSDVIPLEFLDLAVTATDKGFDKVFNGDLRGFELLEVGHACCAYGGAIVKGIALGIWDAGTDMIIDRPLETTMLIISPQSYFAYQLGKLTINLAGNGLTYLFDAKKGRQKWNNDYVAPIKGIISVLTSNEVSGPEKVSLIARMGTGVLVDFIATKKLKKLYKAVLIDPRFQNLGKSLLEQLESKFAEIPKIKLTALEATKFAKRLGFQKTNYYSHGQPVYKKGKYYITPDVDSHSGGVWKMAKNDPKNLFSKGTRLGTYDLDLNKIGN